LVVPGHADDAVSLWLGYGRQGAESLAAGVGFNAYALRSSDAPDFMNDVHIAPTGRTHQLARTQLELAQHGRDIAYAVTLAEYRRDPGFTRDDKGPLPSLFPPFRYTGLQWAMSIDLAI